VHGQRGETGALAEMKYVTIIRKKATVTLRIMFVPVARDEGRPESQRPGRHICTRVLRTVLACPVGGELT